MLPNSLNYTFNIDNNLIADSGYVSGTKPGAKFTLVADLYNTGWESGSPGHCTTITRDAYMIPHIVALGKSRMASETTEAKIR